MKVSNMISSKGNRVANQFIIEDCVLNYPCNDDIINGNMFQSYQSNIAFIGYYNSGHKVVLLDSKYWDYSVITGKYRNQFLGETKKETQKKIDSGEYLLANLN